MSAHSFPSYSPCGALRNVTIGLPNWWKRFLGRYSSSIQLFSVTGQICCSKSFAGQNFVLGNLLPKVGENQKKSLQQLILINQSRPKFLETLITEHNVLLLCMQKQ